MRRILPPIVILGVLGFIVARVLSEPAREETRAQIESILHDASLEKEVLSRIERYLVNFNTADDRWYAARVYLHLRHPGKALDAIWPERGGTITSDDARRFGELALTALGWSDAKRQKPSQAEYRSLIALTERPHPWADARLLDYAKNMPNMASLTYFFHALREANERPVRILVEGYRTRTAPQYASMAAHTMMREEPYPERAADLEVLYEVLETKRREERPNWAAAVVALGRSKDPRGLALLKEYEQRLAGSTNPQDRVNLALLYTGRIARGDWSKAETVRGLVFGEEFDPFVVAWYLEAVLDRYRVHDPEAPEALREMFIKRPSVELRARIVTKLLLSEAPLPLDTEERKLAVDEILGRLKEEGTPLGVALVLSYDLRVGRPDALTNLVAFLRRLETLLQDRRRLGDILPAYMAGLRAMYLYG